MNADQRRLKRLIAEAPGRFGLDLTGLTVLTEAASGPFVSTALIAACAGAEVRAVTRDSSYATARDVASTTMALAAELGVAERLTVSVGRAAAVAEGCHIVTNLGFVRPIADDIVAKLDPCAVVALMWEPWEFRAEDISLTALAARSIPLIGTLETHPLIATFRYVGALAGKLVLESGIELVGARIGVVGSDPFGRATAGWLADAGASPAEIVDQIRDLGWQGVIGNTDEMLAMPETLEAFASASPHMRPVFTAVGEMAAASREALGEERLSWLHGLPRMQMHGPVALVHASPEDCWRAPAPEASQEEMEGVYGLLGAPVVAYGHIHRSFIRNVGGMIVVNTGSVSLSYDGDPRAAYLLLDDAKPVIRRVEYAVDRERKALSDCGMPQARWIANMLASGSFQMP